MADYEHPVAQLKYITKDPNKLDGDIQKRILDATKSCSTRLLPRPPTEQLSALNEPFFQTIDPWLLQNGSTATNTVTAPLEWNSLPDNNEAWTKDPRTVGFSQQSTEALPASFGSYAIHYNHESPGYNPMGMTFNQQQAQDSQISTIFNNLSHNWSPSFPCFSPSMTNFVSPSFLNRNNQALAPVNTAYDPFPLDLTTDSYNDFGTTVPLGSPTDTNISLIGMDYGFTINTLNSIHSAPYLNDIGQNAWRIAPSPVDQSHTGSNYLSSWPARSSSDTNIDHFIAEEPTGTVPFSHCKEPPTPGDFHQLTLSGRTTPNVDLGPSILNIAPALVDVSAGSNCDLSRDGQQALRRELKARNPSSLSVRSVSGKTARAIRKANTMSSPRKPKSPEKRRKTAERRRIGACCLCSRDRQECSGPEGSCDRCTKIMGSLLASHICLTGLQIHRSKIHGMYGAASRITKTSEIGSGPCVAVTTLKPNQTLTKDIIILGGAPLEILARSFVRDEIVQQYSERSIKEVCAAVLGRVHIVDNLDTWGRELLIAKSRRFPDKLECSMDSFLQAYCNVSPSLPVHSCANAVLRIVSLSRYHGGSRPSPNIESVWPLIDQLVWISEDLRTLLYVLAVGDITETEKELLGMLDEKMRECERNHRHPNSVMLGLCIRRLSLEYRRRFSQYRHFDKKYSKNASILGLADKAKRMYDGCISAYSTVYRKGNSPYSANWRLEDHSNEFRNDAGLIEMFRCIMRAERKYCEALDEKNEDDKVLRELFLHTKQRGQKSWSG